MFQRISSRPSCEFYVKINRGYTSNSTTQMDFNKAKEVDTMTHAIAVKNGFNGFRLLFVTLISVLKIKDHNQDLNDLNLVKITKL
ncbi:Uncharacterised protein [Legionella quateirensis]|uniref:Uncharacterized protein n=1 Tax=Legionella quateirensis TaxID=45072 RepID=A0A378KRD3_9GAMM|nr:hypothetical protein Lqua_3401 [Legionella quateirensis]STY17122.1 Uncharacterised protein [Legionella quateirensis]